MNLPLMLLLQKLLPLQVPLQKVLNANPGINYYKQNEPILGVCFSLMQYFPLPKNAILDVV
jgi:hypothetical protein